MLPSWIPTVSDRNTSLPDRISSIGAPRWEPNDRKRVRSSAPLGGTKGTSEALKTSGFRINFVYLKLPTEVRQRHGTYKVSLISGTSVGS